MSNNDVILKGFCVSGMELGKVNRGRNEYYPMFG
jgi:hypothetical protein